LTNVSLVCCTWILSLFFYLAHYWSNPLCTTLLHKTYLSLEELLIANCFMQLHMPYKQLKNVLCNYFLVRCDTCSCIKQVAKDNFSTNV
jgi:hypothetical protein